MAARQDKTYTQEEYHEEEYEEGEHMTPHTSEDPGTFAPNKATARVDKLKQKQEAKRAKDAHILELKKELWQVSKDPQYRPPDDVDLNELAYGVGRLPGTTPKAASHASSSSHGGDDGG